MKFAILIVSLMFTACSQQAPSDASRTPAQSSPPVANPPKIQFADLLTTRDGKTYLGRKINPVIFQPCDGPEFQIADGTIESTSQKCPSGGQEPPILALSGKITGLDSAQDAVVITTPDGRQINGFLGPAANNKDYLDTLKAVLNENKAVDLHGAYMKGTNAVASEKNAPASKEWFRIEALELKATGPKG